ncbi:xanthine dehydrogenase family protein subunit M [soil metagenome]
MRPFSLARPRTLDDALELVGSGASALAGGTDLLGLMKAGVAAPERIVDLSGVEGLGGWESVRGRGMRIGALTRLVDIERSEELARALPILHAALADTATAQLRAMGTLGGNLLQRNRCWYFRDDAFHCWLKGGSRCFAREGENGYHAILGAQECVIASPGDLAPALMAYDAQVELRSLSGTREIPLADLYVVPHGNDRREHTIQEGELITAVVVPDAALTRTGTFIKQMDRKAWSFALVTVAAAARVRDHTLRDVRIVLGGVAPVPWRAREAERVLEGRALDEQASLAAADLAVAGAEPLSRNAYKVPLAREIVRRAVLRLLA